MNEKKFATPEEIRQNYFELACQVEEAVKKSGRPSNACKLVAVTKYVDSRAVRALASAGCNEFGESRPQEIWKKTTELKDVPGRWHLIGHLQRNKVKRTLPLLSSLQSLDSARLLEQIQSDSACLSSPLPMLLEINISLESDKTGVSAVDGEALLEAWELSAIQYPQLEIVGLMGMARLQGGVDQARRDFESLRLLRDKWSVQFGLPLHELSMGMSHDFEVAIEQGATMVRIGSKLFETRSS